MLELKRSGEVFSSVLVFSVGKVGRAERATGARYKNRIGGQGAGNASERHVKRGHERDARWGMQGLSADEKFGQENKSRDQGRRRATPQSSINPA